jgi:hypothetical protein
MKSTIDEVIRIYFEVKSIRKTAELTGYSKSGVEYLLKSNNIELFPRNRDGKENSSYKALLSLDPQDPRRLVRDPLYMKSLYMDKQMSIPEISEFIGIDSSTVLIGLKQCNIKRRTKSESLRGKPRPNAQGSKNHNWKGGLSGWRKLARGRLNEHFVRPVMQRDNFQCQWCLSKKNIVVHHHKRTFMEIVELVRLEINESNIDEFVNSIVQNHSLDDGITLCKKCHDNYHKEFGK